MKNLPAMLAAALSLALGSLPTPAFAQGSLTPPGAPAPTMKTLDQIEARTPISSLPYTITNSGSYYLTANLTGFTGVLVGINITVGDVTLDLNGFTLRGVPGSSSGIHISATVTNLTVRNGTVTGWGNCGVDTYHVGYSRNVVLEQLKVSANGSTGILTEADTCVRNCLVIGNGSEGIDSHGGEITGCIARNNGGNGIVMADGTVRQCFAEFNICGFSVTSSRVLDCDIRTNTTYGVVCTGQGNELRGCRISGNQLSGILFSSDSGANVIADCCVANNKFYGIYAFGLGGSLITGNQASLNGSGGIFIGESNNHIENNHVFTFNGVAGISVAAATHTNNVVIKNMVSGGGAATYNYFNPGNNNFGPVGSAVTATSPWANISH